MSYPIDPEKLLEEAADLAGVDAGRGRPRGLRHRLAVSAAYFAAFHGITVEVVRNALPPGAPAEEALAAARWVNHGDVTAVCRLVSACARPTAAIPGRRPGVAEQNEWIWKALSNDVGGGQRQSRVPSDLEFIAEVFPRLQAARHAADYDHLAAFPKATALGHTRDATNLLRRLRANQRNPFVQRFLAMILARASRFRP